MTFFLYMLGGLSIAGSALAFIMAPSAIQEIFGALLWCGGWIMLGVAAIIGRMDKIIGVLESHGSAELPRRGDEATAFLSQPAAEKTVTCRNCNFSMPAGAKLCRCGMSLP
ncbi:hypothetical protein HGO38_01375 [Rhizobium sp. CG5]|uniref:hypothetical protein n=1 Tax=Rhizobium sp. CG5 TaxID=2726076 RepID=UPI002033DECD|nr:hypothetical protein [Rhizobium sp. CG5]MCM2472126.1 hypothetical protein [Rhizobium sp. CG5]